MFRDNIQRALDRLGPEGRAGLLMGFDGITVESCVRPGAGVDLQTVGMEFAHVIAQVRRTSSMIGLGALREVVIHTDRMTVLIQVISDEYFLALGIEAEGNMGKARYLMRLLGPQIRSEL
jgi:predicted regulator of Ras-like GTPase activity (Roadblock/LC7/MglB family)